jgi:hypothetical protein
MTIDHRVDVVGSLGVKLGQNVQHVNTEAIDLDPPTATLISLARRDW